METWIYKPFLAVGAIEFGMERDVIRNTFSQECNTKIYGHNGEYMDDYEDFCVYYTKSGIAEAVEIIRNIRIMMYEECIFPVAIEKVTSRIGGFQLKRTNYIHPDLSIGIYTDENQMKSILLGKKGFFISSIIY